MYQYLVEKADGTSGGAKDGKLSIGEANNIRELNIRLSDGMKAVGSFANVSKYLKNLFVFYYYDYTTDYSAGAKLTKADLQELKQASYFGIDHVKVEDAEVFKEFTRLDFVSISDAGIKDWSFLGSDAFKNATILRLYGNEIGKLPDAISGMTKLREVDFRQNKLTELPDMKALTSLTEAMLSGNYLTKEALKAALPASFTDEKIAEIAKEQIKEYEAEITVDIEGDKVKEGEKIPVTITVKNTGVALEKFYVELFDYNNSGIYFYPVNNGTANYITTEKGVCVSLAHGETLKLSYEITTGKDGQWTKDSLLLSVKAYHEGAESYEYKQAQTDWIYIEKVLNLKVTDVAISNKELVVTDDVAVAETKVIVSVDGEDAASLKAGAQMNLIAKAGGADYTFTLSYNAETKKFEGTIKMGGNSYNEGQYTLTELKVLADNTWKVVSYEGEKNLWTYTNKATDKTSPVLNGIQIFINGTAQASTKFTLKPGDTIRVIADATEESEMAGVLMLYPADFANLTTAQYLEMVESDKLTLQMRSTQYDLEVTKTLEQPFYEGEYKINYLYVADKNSNVTIYYEKDLASYIKEVSPNPSNAGLVENDTTKAELNAIAKDIASLAAKDGAMDQATKANVEAAIANGETISIVPTVSNVPANSVDKKAKEDIQKKADSVFGENTKLLYLDITMDIFGNKSGGLGTLRELNEEISITITLPQELQGDYNYKVIRYHEKTDGTIETAILDAVKNADGTITFKTDCFSMYAIAYSTSAPIDTEDDTDDDSDDDSSNDEDDAPDTGDADMTTVYLVLLAAVMIAVVTCRRTRKAE